jgi:plastocyanin
MKIELLCLTFIIILISGCSQPVSETKTMSVEGDTIMINHFVFDPQELVVDVGTTVTWKHNDNVGHTVVSQAFESESMSRGDEFTFIFNEKGEYEYHCSIHPSMTGKIIVK